jgi:hypothetical protein
MKTGWWGALAMATMALAPTACAAQSYDWGRDHRYERSRDAYSFGYDRGERDGAEQGRDDARHRRSFDFRRDRDYREADNGYRRSYGPRNRYADGYRRGYEQAYRRAYNDNRRHDRWDRRDWDRDRDRRRY